MLQVCCITVVSTMKKISPPENNFPCHIILVDLEFFICGPDSKICIYVGNSSFPQFLWDMQFTQLVEKVCDIKYYVSKKGTAPLYINQFSQYDISVNAAVVLSMLWYRI